VDLKLFDGVALVQMAGEVLAISLSPDV